MTDARRPTAGDRCLRCDTRAPLKPGGTLCKGCAAWVAKAETAALEVRDLSRSGTDQIGRPARHSPTLGGDPKQPGPNE